MIKFKSVMTVLFVLASFSIFAQTATPASTDSKDSTKTVVMIPTGEVNDTVKVRAILDNGNNQLFAKNYLLITRSYVFNPQANVPNQAIERYLMTEGPNPTKIVGLEEKVVWMVRRGKPPVAPTAPTAPKK